MQEIKAELNNINTAANMTAPRVLCSGRFKHLIQAVPLPALITGSRLPLISQEKIIFLQKHQIRQVFCQQPLPCPWLLQYQHQDLHPKCKYQHRPESWFCFHDVADF